MAVRYVNGKEWPLCPSCKSAMMQQNGCFVCNCNIPFGGAHWTYVYAGPMKPRPIEIDPQESAIDSAITAVLKASRHGDQQFRSFLRCDEAAELRTALVQLLEAVRGDIQDGE